MMREQLGRPSMVVGMEFSSALVHGTLPAVAAGAPPRSGESAQEALTRWINGGGWLGGGSSVLSQIRLGYASIYRGF
jgi:hypothetical protein